MLVLVLLLVGVNGKTKNALNEIDHLRPMIKTAGELVLVLVGVVLQRGTESAFGFLPPPPPPPNSQTGRGCLGQLLASDWTPQCT